MTSKKYSILLWILAAAGLVLTILPPVLVFTGAIEFTSHTMLMTLGMFVWFGARIGIQALQDS